MKKHLQVSFKIGNSQEVWIQHPDLSAAVHANEQGTGSFDDIIDIADHLTHRLGFDDVELELGEIHDGTQAYQVELWDYTDGPALIRTVDLLCAN